MKTMLLSAATAAVLGMSIVPVAFAQQASRTGTTPYAGTGAAPACTQLELSLGITGDECGKLSLSELARKKISHDNT